MHFFERYDFFNFNMFDMRFTVILDDNFSRSTAINSLSNSHFHEHWEMYFIKSGAMKVDYHLRSVEYPAGVYVVIPPYTEHCITHKSEDCSHVSIRFMLSESENAINSFIVKLFQDNAQQPIRFNDEILSMLNRLQDLHKKYLQSHKQEFWLHPNITATSMLLFTTILEHSGRELPMLHPECCRKNNEELLPMMIEFMMRYATTSDITISHLAESLNYSVSQTNRILQRQYGKSFREIISDIRIQKAKYYLLQTDFSIDKISELLGFKEAKSFNRSFKMAVGITPSAFRRQNNDISLK